MPIDSSRNRGAQVSAQNELVLDASKSRWWQLVLVAQVSGAVTGPDPVIESENGRCGPPA